MAATNASEIILYHSTSTGVQPPLANLATGELAINTADGILYYKNTGSNTVQAIGSGATANALSFTTSGVSTGATSFDGSTAVTINAATLGGAYADGSNATGTWSISTTGNAATATSLAGGLQYQIPVQSSANNTTFIAAPTVNGTVLSWSAGTFSWISVSGGGGTVTSIDASGGTTGLTFSGGPVTTTGTLTLGGTLNVANGGTGATTFTAGYLKANGTSAFTTSATIPTTDLSGTITNAQLANSTISGVALGNNLAALTINSALTGTSYNGSSAVTLDLATQGGVTPATYGTAISIPVVTVNNKGIITAITEVSTQGNTYLGTWDAATNTPTLADGTGAAGDYYVVTTAGTQNLGSGNLTFAIGDWVIYNGAIWQQVSNSQTAAFTNIALTAVPTGQFLVSNGTGLLTSTATIDLTSKVAGTLPVANGGTNGTATPTAGAVAYGTGTAYAFTSAGTSGQVLTSGGAGAPTWTTPAAGTVTSIATAGTVNGITLTGGPITSTGTITLGGTLDLSAPPAIGSVTPNTGAFTTLTASQNVTLSPATGYTVTINPTDVSAMDNVVIGGNTPKAITGTVITATSYFVGINGGSF